MSEFVELHLEPETLAELGLPDIGYPVPKAEFDIVSDKLHLATLLYGLQWKSTQAGVDWPALEPAMARLALLMTPDDEEAVVTAEGDDWELAIGGVDLMGNDRDKRVVTIQRGAHLIAAIRPLPNGQLRVAAYRPLDAKSAELLVMLSRRPHPEYGVNMFKNNWEYALDVAAGSGSAGGRGEAYVSFWEKGLGVGADGAEIPAWRRQVALPPQRAASIAAALGAWYTFAEAE
ncbi:MAG: draG2 [Moraxellaceae bacterium]|jgi:hypothetical protein|nr:draG2 [Moraxellaceae bacterium]